MGHLADLLNEYENTQIFEPSCGASASHVVLSVFGKTHPSTQEIDLLLNTDLSTGNASLLAIKEYLQANHLHVLPVQAEFAPLIHRIQQGTMIVRGMRDEQLPHFSVVLKKRDRLLHIDVPNTDEFSEESDVEVEDFAKSIGYTGHALLISDQPLEMTAAPFDNASVLSLASITFFAVLAVGVVRRYLIRIGRRHTQRSHG
ncbi:MAG TPA: hypothetical protein HPP83_01660 [Candidatus Hydrogenedentes bacterium]|nr:hypothetical protein [Candidatus Hydrogenedentota bacterium]